MQDLTIEEILTKTDNLTRKQGSTRNIADKVLRFYTKSQMYWAHKYKRRISEENPEYITLNQTLDIQQQFKIARRNIRMVQLMVFEIEDRARQTLEFMQKDWKKIK